MQAYPYSGNNSSISYNNNNNNSNLNNSHNSRNSQNFVWNNFSVQNPKQNNNINGTFANGNAVNINGYANANSTVTTSPLSSNNSLLNNNNTQFAQTSSPDALQGFIYHSHSSSSPSTGIVSTTTATAATPAAYRSYRPSWTDQSIDTFVSSSANTTAITEPISSADIVNSESAIYDEDDEDNGIAGTKETVTMDSNSFQPEAQADGVAEGAGDEDDLKFEEDYVPSSLMDLLSSQELKRKIAKTSHHDDGDDNATDEIDSTLTNNHHVNSNLLINNPSTNTLQATGENINSSNNNSGASTFNANEDLFTRFTANPINSVPQNIKFESDTQTPQQQQHSRHHSFHQRQPLFTSFSPSGETRPFSFHGVNDRILHSELAPLYWHINADNAPGAAAAASASAALGNRNTNSYNAGPGNGDININENISKNQNGEVIFNQKTTQPEPQQLQAQGFNSGQLSSSLKLTRTNLSPTNATSRAYGNDIAQYNNNSNVGNANNGSDSNSFNNGKYISYQEFKPSSAVSSVSLSPGSGYHTQQYFNSSTASNNNANLSSSYGHTINTNHNNFNSGSISSSLSNSYSNRGSFGQFNSNGNISNRKDSFTTTATTATIGNGNGNGKGPVGNNSDRGSFSTMISRNNSFKDPRFSLFGSGLGNSNANGNENGNVYGIGNNNVGVATDEQQLINGFNAINFQ